MSFLAGRLAGKEGAFFYEQTKRAVVRLAETCSSSVAPSMETNSDSKADVLPEVLRHSLPSKAFSKSSSADSKFLSSKWTLNSYDPCHLPDSSRNWVNPLREYVSFPQVTFGPKRWELPSGADSVVVSSANELRRDRTTGTLDKRKDAMAGLTMIGKAFAIATTFVFGMATIAFCAVASNLDVQNTEDIQTIVKDRTQPKIEMIREKLSPLRCWVDKTSQKWHIGGDGAFKDKPIVKELSKVFGAKPNL